MVDRAEHLRWIVCLQKGAGTVIDGLAGDGSVIRIHHAVDEAEQHPLCDQSRLPRDHPIQQSQVGLLCQCGLRIVPGDRIVRQLACPFGIALRCEILEGSHAEVACCYPGEHSPRQNCFAQYSFSGGDCGQGARSRNTQRRHGLAHQVLAQNRAQRGSAVPTARERGAAGTLKLDIVAHAIASYDLAQQVSSAVTELRHKMAELVPGIGHGEWLGAHRHQVAGQDRHPLCACEGVRIEAQLMGQSSIHLDQARGCYRCRVYPGVEALRQPHIRVFETKKDSIVGA